MGFVAVCGCCSARGTRCELWADRVSGTNLEAPRCDAPPLTGLLGPEPLTLAPGAAELPAREGFLGAAQ